VKEQFEQHRISERFAIERLSARKRNQREEWLNRGFLQVRDLKQIKVHDVSQILSIIQTYFTRTRREIVSAFPDETHHVISFERQSDSKKCPKD
jgi:hypothetical protein